MQPALQDEREHVASRHPDLTSKQIAFVTNYVANGGNGTAAAKDAGYATKSAHVEAHRLLGMSKVIRAVADLTTHALGAALPGALATVVRLSTVARSEYVQLEASKDLLDRAGLSAPKKVLVSGDVRVTYDFT
jgi:hypothetical protein